jgi:dipeptidyl aminopeptidase/acylaminoacyl peptidase
VTVFAPFPDGQRLLLAMDVLPKGKTLADTKAHDDAQEQSKVKARAYDELMFRHWSDWEDGKRSHVFVWSPSSPEPIDLMAGMDVDAPTHPFGGAEELAISPDGKVVVFAAKSVGREAAWSTNVDLWQVAADGKSKPQPLTADNAAWDGNPSFSPDGKQLAWLAMARPVFEADRTRIVVMDRATKKKRTLTEQWDRSPGELSWSQDGKTLFTSADHLGNHALFAVDVRSGAERLLVGKGTNQGPQPAGARIVFARDTLHLPVELFSAAADGSDLRAITAVNAERVASIDWQDYEQFTFTGAGGDTVSGYVVKPRGWVAGKKFPVAMLIHGGPQGSLGDHFHYRWNPMPYAGAGYGVVFIDFHGSTGYGQAFTDAIRGDWGGAPYEDLMKGLDAALAKYPWLDGNKACALGASYGGYMINWINGHTDRFKCLVAHASNLDERFAYYDTEELWFPEWEHGGTPWDNPQGYAKHNPIDFVKNWKTPTLVVHGALDYRVVETQGMGVFTALQRRGVPSRFLYFPDENHWVLKPQNSALWHREVLSWLGRFTK